MNETWGVIEDFPLYEISNDGDVRNRKTGRILKSWGDEGQKFVGLRRDGKTHNRSVELLRAATFPVMRDGVWRVVPGFPGYEIGNSGTVRNRKTGRILQPYLFHRQLSVGLTRGSRMHVIPVQKILNETFPRTGISSAWSE